MLYFLYGSDIAKRKARRLALLHALQNKRPDAEVFEREPEGFEEKDLDELLWSQGLFERKCIVIGKGFFSTEETKKIFQEKLGAIAESPNVFLLEESSVLKPMLQKIEKHAERIFHTGDAVLQTKNQSAWNGFALADALGNKDKKKLWVLYRQAVRAEVSSEEMHGMLFWQVKTLLLAEGTKSAGEAGLNPYPYQKAKGFLKHYSPEELREISSKLVSLYHDAHQGKGDLENTLERMILDL
ncbi:MAG TPA: hypothetical protein VFM02_00525 [Candidatus Paceibacterota bacterium]|nr:hypothetical protein [Candidatus Paceibacterota bacterium]